MRHTRDGFAPNTVEILLQNAESMSSCLHVCRPADEIQNSNEILSDPANTFSNNCSTAKAIWWQTLQVCQHKKREKTVQSKRAAENDNNKGSPQCQYRDKEAVQHEVHQQHTLIPVTGMNTSTNQRSTGPHTPPTERAFIQSAGAKLGKITSPEPVHPMSPMMLGPPFCFFRYSPDSRMELTMSCSCTSRAPVPRGQAGGRGRQQLVGYPWVSTLNLLAIHRRHNQPTQELHSCSLGTQCCQQAACQREQRVQRRPDEGMLSMQHHAVLHHAAHAALCAHPLP
jgi:hypothetical protein